MASVAVGQRPEIVHAHDLNTLRAAFVVADSSGAQVVYDSHELAVARNQVSERGNRRARRLEDRLVPRCAAVITASPGYSRHLHLRYGCDPLSLLNVPDLVRDVPRLPQLPRRADALLAVYVGSIQPNRGIETAILSLHFAPDWDLAVVGYGHHRADLELMARSEGLEERVHFTGPVAYEQLIAAVATADAGLCLIVGEARSYELSVPNKLFEYFAAGLPVVAADLPELGPIAQSTGAAILVSPTEPRLVAATLKSLQDASRREAMAGKARVAHLERFNWPATEADLLAMYERIHPIV